MVKVTLRKEVKVELLKVPNSLLRKKSETLVEPYPKEIAEELSLIRQENGGAGIAAPQIGKLVRMINIVYRGVEYTIINPVIKHKKGTQYSFEGCLSVPDYIYKVKRSLTLTLFGEDIHGKEIKLKCNQDEAPLIGHEVDHLNGILIDKRGEVYGRKEGKWVDKLAWGTG